MQWFWCHTFKTYSESGQEKEGTNLNSDVMSYSAELIEFEHEPPLISQEFCRGLWWNLAHTLCGYPKRGTHWVFHVNYQRRFFKCIFDISSCLTDFVQNWISS